VSADVAIRAASQEDAERLAVLLTELGYPAGAGEVRDRLAYWLPAGERRTGTGRALLDAAEVLAGEWGCLLIEVTSRRSRADAHAFYRSQGYIDVCDRSGRFTKELGCSGDFPVCAQHLPRSGLIRIGHDRKYQARPMHRLAVSDIRAAPRRVLSAAAPTE
jgi:hypothetical protein